MLTVQEELEALRSVVEELTGLRSRWSGRVVSLDDLQLQSLHGGPVFAKKVWNCDILINTDITLEPWRWRTFLHEIFHSVSVGMNEHDYVRFRGWEEGVVEWLQRTLRHEALSKIGVRVPETTFQDFDIVWAYNRYLEALASLQQASGVAPDDFYMGLLHIPLSQRLSATRALKNDLEYQRLFAGMVGELG